MALRAAPAQDLVEELARDQWYVDRKVWRPSQNTRHACCCDPFTQLAFTSHPFCISYYTFYDHKHAITLFSLDQ